MEKSLLLFQSVVILLTFLVAAVFIATKSYLESILYIAIGMIFFIYAFSSRKKKTK